MQYKIHHARQTMLALALVPALCLPLVGCDSGSETMSRKTYDSGDTAISAIVIDVKDSAVAVAASKDDQVHIEYGETDKQRYDIAAADGTLTMRSVDNRNWSDYIGVSGSGDRTVTVSVPENSMDSLSVATTKQDIDVSALSADGEISLSANNDDIDFDSLDAGKAVRLNVKNGDIDGTLAGDYGDYTITTSIKKGDSNLPSGATNGDKTLDVTANNGDVNIQFRQ